MARIHNFSAGPAVLPESVLEKAQKGLWDLNDSGLGVMECSHRSALYDAVICSARERLKKLLRLDSDQEVLFLQGGARTQFYQVPMTFLNQGTASYLDTGRWADSAAADARRFGNVEVLFSSKDTGYDRVPAQGSFEDKAKGVYLHYTSNNTVAGSEFHYVPEVNIPLVCDMSSDILSRPVDGSKFHLIYAGAQKNLGPAGCTIVVVRKSWLENANTDLPSMLQYGVQIQKDSMLNTPPTFAIYVIDLVTQWIEECGGLEAIEARNKKKAAVIYDAIESLPGFEAKVKEGSRSLMNITFTTGDADRDTAFWKEAANQGLSGLKGHRSVGGLRASVYNAQTMQAVEALAAFMKSFQG